MRSRRITRVLTIGISVLCAFAYACVGTEEVSIAEQALMQLNGSNLNGSNLNGMSLRGFFVSGATKNSSALTNLRVEKGELLAELGGVTLSGDDFDGVELVGEARSDTAPATSANVEYRITDVIPEDEEYDPLEAGNTYLYTLERWNGETGTWVAACPTDVDGRAVAIPVAAEWDHTGARTDSSTMFTLACTTGVIAKCYRWGYRPWVTGYGDLATMHWTCTRLARADYCGNGVSYTQDGTLINVWDTLSSPIQDRGSYSGTYFDAAWNTSGATCLSTTRWSEVGSAITAMCPTKLPAPGAGGTACNSQQDAVSQDSSVKMFRELFED